MKDFNIEVGSFEIRLAKTPEELVALQKLRYIDMILDYNENNIDSTELDSSPFDDHCDHIIAIDKERNLIVGTYRLISSDHLKENEEFICSTEFNIDKLINENQKMLELSRAVVHHEYRNGIILKLMWQFLFIYAIKKQIRFIIGTASYHGLDINQYRHSLSNIYYYHKITEYDVPSIDKKVVSCQQLPIDEIVSLEVKKETPPLIRSYIMMGANMSKEVFFDRSFNSIDVFVLMDMTTVNIKYIEKFIGYNLS